MLTLVVGVISALFLAIGFSRPLDREVPAPHAYQQAGNFFYSGVANTPTPVYPSGVVKTGEPVYSSLVASIRLGFSYRFKSALPHHIKGTIELNALVLSPSNTWKQLSTVVKQRSFIGDRTSTQSTFPLNALYALIDSVSTQTGVPGEDYSAQLKPIIDITGSVGGKPINSTFSPVLDVTISQTTLSVDEAAAPVPLGATYTPATPSHDLSVALHPVQTGTIPEMAANVVTIAKYTIAVPSLRMLGIVLALVAVLLAVVHDLLRRRTSHRTAEDLIAGRRRSLIVPVAVLSDPGEPVSVPDFTDLAGLAAFLEQPILYEVRNGQRTYAVDDDAHRYVYQPNSDSDSGPSAAPEGGVASRTSE